MIYWIISISQVDNMYNYGKWMHQQYINPINYFCFKMFFWLGWNQPYCYIRKQVLMWWYMMNVMNLFQIIYVNVWFCIESIFVKALQVFEGSLFFLISTSLLYFGGLSSILSGKASKFFYLFCFSSIILLYRLEFLFF